MNRARARRVRSLCSFYEWLLVCAAPRDHGFAQAQRPAHRQRLFAQSSGANASSPKRIERFGGHMRTGGGDNLRAVDAPSSTWTLAAWDP